MRWHAGLDKLLLLWQETKGLGEAWSPVVYVKVQACIHEAAQKQPRMEVGAVVAPIHPRDAYMHTAVRQPMLPVDSSDRIMQW